MHFAQFLTRRKHGSFGETFYSSIAKLHSLQKQCKNYPKIHGHTKGDGRSHHGPLNTPLGDINQCPPFSAPPHSQLPLHLLTLPFPKSPLEVFGVTLDPDISSWTYSLPIVHICISPAPRNGRRRPGRPRHTCLRTVEEDLRQFNLGLASGLRRAQNRTAWRALTGTATSPTSSD